MMVSMAAAIERSRMWLLGQPWFVGKLLPALPRSVRWGLRKIYLTPVDIVDRYTHRERVGVPPKAATFTGGVRDYAESGEFFVGALRDVAGLTPSSRILDIGSGLGRLALPMVSYLDASGSYDGLEIVPSAVEWCRKNVIGPYANIHFAHADVYNKEYNPKGRYRAAEYRLPYDDGSFNLVVLFSVFTHMMPADVDRYVGEIARVLEPGGRSFITFFLFNEESERIMRSSPTGTRFGHRVPPYWTYSPKIPELAIGFDESYIQALYARNGLVIDEVYRGAWCGRVGHWPNASGLGGQDVIVATKSPPADR
jgi:SAM-dependent methyltransferase